MRCALEAQRFGPHKGLGHKHASALTQSRSFSRMAEKRCQDGGSAACVAKRIMVEAFAS